jgi:hypothetical protein
VDEDVAGAGDVEVVSRVACSAASRARSSVSFGIGDRVAVTEMPRAAIPDDRETEEEDSEEGLNACMRLPRSSLPLECGRPAEEQHWGAQRHRRCCPPSCFEAHPISQRAPQQATTKTPHELQRRHQADLKWGTLSLSGGRKHELTSSCISRACPFTTRVTTSLPRQLSKPDCTRRSAFKLVRSLRIDAMSAVSPCGPRRARFHWHRARAPGAHCAENAQG